MFIKGILYISSCFLFWPGLSYNTDHNSSHLEREQHRLNLLRKLNGRKIYVHGRKSREIQLDIKKYERKSYDPKLSVLTTSSLPDDPRFMPSVGNGHIAHVVHSNVIFMSLIYNGKGPKSHRAQIPDMCAVRFVNATFDQSATVSYSFDMGKGMFIEEYVTDYQIVRLKKYAHSAYNRLMVTEVEATNLGGSSMTVNLKQTDVTTSPDINFNLTENEDFRLLEGFVIEPEVPRFNISVVSIASTKIPEVITVHGNQHTSFLCLQSIGYSPFLVEYMFMFGNQAFLMGELEEYQEFGTSFTIWNKGRIETPGNDQITSLLYSSLYYMMTSIPIVDKQIPYMGLSPTGLAQGGNNSNYMGHVFWDQEIYMFPPIQLLYPKAGRILLKSRARSLMAAKKEAEKQGYKGALYPFESAVSGKMVNTLEKELYGIHVNGDIALAFAYDYLTTNDTDFFSKIGGDVLENVADFWISRVNYSEEKHQYEIYDVMGPDSFHFPVNNSAYTNSIARTSLEIANFILTKVNRSSNPLYTKIAQNMYIPFDKENNWTPQFDGYKKGTKIGQADVMLIYWPIVQRGKQETLINDLNAYINVTDGEPAMSWGMYTIGWLMANNSQKAEDTFKKQLQNVNGPFNVWTKDTDGKGPVNFLTGMGAFLQSILFGYGGIRFDVEGLRMYPTLPPGSNALNIYGMDYLKTSFDILCTSFNITINITKEVNPLDVQLSDGSRKPLYKNSSTTIDLQEIIIASRK